MSEVARFEVFVPLGRWWPGQQVEAAVGAALPSEGIGALHALHGELGGLRARFLPGPGGRWRDLDRTLAALWHPSMVPVVGGGVHGERAFLVETQPRGLPLRTWVATRRDALGHLPAAEAAAVLGAVAGALRHASAAGVIHGALHASEVTVALDGAGGVDACVSGFGLIQAARGTLGAVPADLLAALAPEVIDGTDAPSERTDLFAFAVLATELLARAPLPPDGHRTWAEFAGDVEALRAFVGRPRTGLPLGARAWIGRALARDPAQRGGLAPEELPGLLDVTAPGGAFGELPEDSDPTEYAPFRAAPAAGDSAFGTLPEGPPASVPEAVQRTRTRANRLVTDDDAVQTLPFDRMSSRLQSAIVAARAERPAAPSASAGGDGTSHPVGEEGAAATEDDPTLWPWWQVVALVLVAGLALGGVLGIVLRETRARQQRASVEATTSARRSVATIAPSTRGHVNRT